LIDDIEKLASKRVVIGTPNGPHAPTDHDIYTVPSQKHKDYFTFLDFSAREGYIIRGQGLELIYGDKGLMRKLPRFLKLIVSILSYLASPLVYLIPQILAHIICIKDLRKL